MSAAQGIILLIAVGCVFVVYNAYQQANQPPPPLTLASVAPRSDPKLARYAAQIQVWQAAMAQRQMTVTWPYLGGNNVVRVDLPDKVPITLAPWDDTTERQAAVQAYVGFSQTRKRVPVANPGACIVHVFLPSADPGASGSTEVAQASAAGVVTSADQNLGGG